MISFSLLDLSTLKLNRASFSTLAVKNFFESTQDDLDYEFKSIFFAKLSAVAPTSIVENDSAHRGRRPDHSDDLVSTDSE